MVSTPFPYSFDNIGTVCKFWTPHDGISRGYFELSLPSKQNHRFKFLELMKISPTIITSISCQKQISS